MAAAASSSLAALVAAMDEPPAVPSRPPGHPPIPAVDPDEIAAMDDATPDDLFAAALHEPATAAVATAEPEPEPTPLVDEQGNLTESGKRVCGRLASEFWYDTRDGAQAVALAWDVIENDPKTAQQVLRELDWKPPVEPPPIMPTYRPVCAYRSRRTRPLLRPRGARRRRRSVRAACARRARAPGREPDEPDPSDLARPAGRVRLVPRRARWQA